MAVDWTQVLAQAVQAAQGVLAGKWPVVRQAATAQITALIANAKAIEDAKDTMTEDEYELVKRIQKRALTGVLAGFEAIGIVAAEQAAEAAWDVVAGALRTATGLAFI
ncbi:MAG: hypothetical protein WDN25_31080 [Acetobacteraceae bacterium]